MFDFPQPKFHIVATRSFTIPGEIASRPPEHFRCHVHPDGSGAWPTLAPRDEAVETGARSQIEDYLARLERSDRRRIAARQAQVSPFRQLSQFFSTITDVLGEQRRIGGIRAATAD